MTPSRSAFSYAAIRVVPDIEREEFLNAGVVLFCRPLRYLEARTRLDVAALEALHPRCDTQAIAAQLQMVERIAAGDPGAGPVGRMQQSQRFHWLTTPRSTLVQPGAIHTGLTDDPTATFEHLFRILVERPA